MTDAAVMTLLSQHRMIGTAPVAEHEWLAAHGTRRTLAVGDVLTRKGE